MCIYAIAGVSSPNCGDKVEVQLLFMAFLYLKKIEVLFDVYMNCIPTNNNQSHLKTTQQLYHGRTKAAGTREDLSRPTAKA